VLPTARLGAASRRAEPLFWASRASKSAQGYIRLSFHTGRL
jgi:hypothetical protein